MNKPAQFVILCAFAASAPGGEPVDRLREALTHHASFDEGYNADFSRGDPTLYAYGNAAERMRGGTPAAPDTVTWIDANAGRHGGALLRSAATKQLLFYRNEGILNYDAGSWSGTVSVWLKLDPDKDLGAGYCDPVQIIGGSGKKGYIFLEWSKAEPAPRRFRYAILPKVEHWNPDGDVWDEMPVEKRPMVQVEQAPFSREAWTHVVFTFDRLNRGYDAAGRLYLNGNLQGAIENWNLMLDWIPDEVALVLGAAYIGYMDDLTVFNRALTGDEVRMLRDLPSGGKALH